jgi:hypothetical protein
MAEHTGVTRAKEYLEIFATGDLDALQDFRAPGDRCSAEPTAGVRR